MLTQIKSDFNIKNINMHEVSVGNQIYNLIKELYPICRSITGNGVRESLKIIQSYIPINIHEVPSGTAVFDWKVPKEWNIKDAYIKNSRGEKIIDFKKSNLHVLNYSVPVHEKMNLPELKKHLFSLPEYPDWIPYLTSYYNENWGFCLTHNKLQALIDDEYEVFIDSSLCDGSLSYGELKIKGKTDEEILFTTYICHPSLCNDNLSGPTLLTFLAKQLLALDLNYSYRFLFIPETIGAISWLALNEDKVSNIRCGLLATCVGDCGISTYKKTRNESSLIDKIVEKVLIDSGQPYKIVPFSPWGSDERQFSSPAFGMELGSLMRTPYACFPEYHTSADNLDFMNSDCLQDSFNKYLQVVFILENNRTYQSTNPKCEPQLGKRGLYSDIGSRKDSAKTEEAMFWVLNLSDGAHSLLDMALRSKLKFEYIKLAADFLFLHKLLEIKGRN